MYYECDSLTLKYKITLDRCAIKINQSSSLKSGTGHLGLLYIIYKIKIYVVFFYNRKKIFKFFLFLFLFIWSKKNLFKSFINQHGFWIWGTTKRNIQNLSDSIKWLTSNNTNEKLTKYYEHILKRFFFLLVILLVVRDIQSKNRS